MAITEKITDNYAIYNRDCIQGMSELPDNTIHLSIYSPPFASLYTYTSYDNDLGNASNYEEFLEHYEYVIKELSRVTMTGRLSCVHCMEIPSGLNYGGLIDFPGDIIRLYAKHGFEYRGRNVIWKEPLKMALRTRSLALMHKQLVKDSSFSRVAMADYILVFKKNGENKIPIKHEYGLNYFAGDIDAADPDLRDLYKNQRQKYATCAIQQENRLSQLIWRSYASSVWMDIRPGNLLSSKEAKDPEDEKHVCALQLDVIDRCIHLYSNPNEKVLTPFLGIGSEVYCSIRSGRKGIGFELKPTYFKAAINNLNRLEEAMKTDNSEMTMEFLEEIDD